VGDYVYKPSTSLVVFLEITIVSCSSRRKAKLQPETQPSRQIQKQYLKRGHWGFLLNPSSFVIHKHPCNQRYTNYEAEKASLNKLRNNPFHAEFINCTLRQQDGMWRRMRWEDEYIRWFW